MNHVVFKPQPVVSILSLGLHETYHQVETSYGGTALKSDVQLLPNHSLNSRFRSRVIETFVHTHYYGKNAGR